MKCNIYFLLDGSWKHSDSEQRQQGASHHSEDGQRCLQNAAKVLGNKGERHSEPAKEERHHLRVPRQAFVGGLLEAQRLQRERVQWAW